MSRSAKKYFGAARRHKVCSKSGSALEENVVPDGCSKLHSSAPLNATKMGDLSANQFLYVDDPYG